MAVAALAALAGIALGLFVILVVAPDHPQHRRK